jgi:signal transduction histidine kinase
VLVVGFGIAVMLEAALGPDLNWRIPSLLVALALLPTLLWRRTHPFAMVAFGFSTIIVLDVARVIAGVDPVVLGSMAYMLLLAISLFRWGSGPEIVGGLAIMLVAASMSVVFAYTGLDDAIGGFVFFFAVLAFSLAIRYRGRARQRAIEQVRLLERERLARDLHDTVAHHVSGIAIRAQAGLATASTDPDAAVDALRVIESEASRTLTEMRTMVRMLRRDDETVELAPTPLVGDLARLGSDDPSAPRLHLHIAGEVESVPEPVSTALYRIAQESITNVRRHARHASRVDVTVRADDTTVALRVADDGEPVADTAAVQHGFGIRGMVERADLLGGTCVAGPGHGGGWEVCAELPKDGGRQ